jgi:class 3 adenylate cyclase/tetratricopeptide (TPR) repeat protein
MADGPTIIAAADMARSPIGKLVDADHPTLPAAPELRNVTVLFADVVRSTQAVLALNPEEARTYLDQVVEFMLMGVRRFGGAVCGVQGDGVMAVFGTPSATEDHALRGCMAAMAIRDAFMSFPAFPGVAPTRVRIGLHSGGVMTRPAANGSGDMYDAAGAVVHLASKIERMCPPQSVAASVATIRLVRGFVRSASLGALNLEEGEAPLPVEQLLEVSPDYQLEHYFGHRRLSPLVGRDAELKALAGMVGPGSPGVIGILGEAGLGKSRLCFEATAMAQSAGRRVVQVRGVSVNSATPFAALRASITQLLLLDEYQPEEELRARLDAVGLENIEAAGVGSILGLAPTDDAWKSMSGDARKQAITQGVARTITTAAGRLPLLLIIEDLHDLDQETLACLKAALVGDERLCAIVTSRPEGAVELAQLSGRVLRLDQLAPPDARRLVLNALPTVVDEALRQPEGGLIDSLLQRGAGNPFVLEELVRGLASPAARGIGGVPMSIEILIRSRVDRLSDDARRLLHCASVIGVRFPALVLRHVAGLDADPFEAALRELVQERLLIAGADMSVEFNHQITRLATYEGIPQAGRARLHAGVLDVALAGEHQLALSHEALAHHANCAGQKERALDFLWDACREAIGHSAVQSVIELRRRALVICAELGPAADMREVDFNLLTFDAINQLSDLHELVEPLERALTICAEAGSKRKICQVTAHLATTYLVIGRYKLAALFAKRALAAAKAAGDLPMVTYAQYILGWAEFHRGHIENAVRLEQDLGQQLSGGLETARFGAVGVMSVRVRSFASWFLTDLGRFDDAAREAAEATRVADVMRQPLSQLLADMAVGYCLFRRGRLDDACDVLEKAYGICRSGAILGLEGFISGWFASALVHAGRDEEASRIVQRAIDYDLGRFCCVAGTYYTYEAKARLLARAGRAAEAMQALEHAVSAMLSTRDSPHYAYGLFSRGELKRTLGIEVETAERDFRWALRRARRLGMRPLQADCEQALNVAR